MRRSFFISIATCRGMMLSRSFSCVQDPLIDTGDYDGDGDDDPESVWHVIIHKKYNYINRRVIINTMNE